MNNQAELISIGNELLCGQTLNTHGQDLGETLAAIGLQLVRDTTIPDDVSTIQSATREALARVDLIFVSGGLGPTVDDITRDALGQLLERKIMLHSPTVDHLKGWYKKRGRNITDAGKRQALVLENCAVLPNSVGAAPGQRIDLSAGKTLFVLPGPPNEFNAILSEEIVPWLKDRYADARPRLVRTVLAKGIGESDIVTILEEAAFQPEDIDLGFYPGGGQVKIRLAADPEKESEILEAEQQLLDLLADFIDKPI
ncbi:MAG: molybdopterin-binding protein [Verrucomicrobiota bacterium]